MFWDQRIAISIAAAILARRERQCRDYSSEPHALVKLYTGDCLRNLIPLRDHAALDSSGIKIWQVYSRELLILCNRATDVVNR
jgi:hypothetical protein